MTAYKRILIAFGSPANNALMREVIRQFERHALVDCVDDAASTIAYLVRHRARNQPGIVVFDLPPVSPNTISLIGLVRANMPDLAVPIILLLLPTEITAMQHWVMHDKVYLYVHPSKPSELKQVIRQTLDHYESLQPVGKQ